MEKKLRDRLAYISTVYIAAIYANLAVRNMILGRNDRMGVFYTLFVMMAAAFIVEVLKSRLGFMDIMMFAVFICGGVYTSARCSTNQFYFIAAVITIVLIFLFVRYKVRDIDTGSTPDEVFRAKLFILKTLHFGFIFSLLFVGLETVTVFSTVITAITIFFIAAVRYSILYDVRHILIIGTLLEITAFIFMVLVMPRCPLESIVAFQMENTVGSYINGFVCALVLSLLEIPLNPVWNFEKNLKG